MADDNHEPYTAIRKLLPFTTAVVIIVALYVGYLVFTRWKERRDVAASENRQQVENARQDIAQYGNGNVTVLNFNVTPAVVRRGGKASICYGVSNAKTVVIDPKPDENVWPSVARCVEASPKKTTTYTITAKDDSGHSDTKNVTVTVR
jgi:type II secretory pathway pseudopilin PulG